MSSAIDADASALPPAPAAKNARVARPTPPWRQVSLAELAAAAEGACIPHKLLIHSAAHCECEAPADSPAKELLPSTPHTLWVRIARPFKWESDDHKRKTGIDWADRVDPVYFLFAVHSALYPTTPSESGASQLQAEAGLLAAWSAAAQAPPAWNLEILWCGRKGGPEMYLGSVAAILPPGLAASAPSAFAAALLRRGDRGGDDAVVALGSAPLSQLAAAEAIQLLQSVRWSDCCRDAAVALPQLHNAAGAGKESLTALSASNELTIKFGHHCEALRSLLAASEAAPGCCDPLPRLVGEGGSVLLQVQHYADKHQVLVDVQGGGRQAGEPSLQSALRELEEESGVGGAAAQVDLEVIASLNCDAVAAAAVAAGGEGPTAAAAGASSSRSTLAAGVAPKPTYRMMHLVKVSALRGE